MEHLNCLRTNRLRSITFVAALRRTILLAILLSPEMIMRRGSYTWMRNAIESSGVNTKLSCHNQQTTIPNRLIMSIWSEHMTVVNNIYAENLRTATAMMRNPQIILDRSLKVHQDHLHHKQNISPKNKIES